MMKMRVAQVASWEPTLDLMGRQEAKHGAFHHGLMII